MMGKSAFRLILCALLLFLTAISGCNSTDSDDDPESEVFQGIYIVRDLTIVEDARLVDSVLMTVTNNRNYALFFWDADGLFVDFCNCEGSIFDFGTNLAVFNPRFVQAGNCDTVRIPRGEFVADFVTHGDTVYFEQRSIDSLFQLQLLPK